MTHLLNRFRGSLSRRKERQSEKRLKKARALKKIRESNLPQETQRKEIQKLHRGKFSRFKSRFRKERPMSKARFGTESEKSSC